MNGKILLNQNIRRGTCGPLLESSHQLKRGGWSGKLDIKLLV